MANRNIECSDIVVGESATAPGGRAAEVTMELTGEHIGNVHLRTVDTLTVMYRRGTLSSEQYNAGQDFATAFAIGHLDGFKSVALDRAPGGGMQDSTTERMVLARQRVDRALEACGGRSSPGGMILWHVVGLGRTIKEYCDHEIWNGKRISQDVARGCLIGTLGTLAGHYGYTSRFHRKRLTNTDSMNTISSGCEVAPQAGARGRRAQDPSKSAVR